LIVAVGWLVIVWSVIALVVAIALVVEAAAVIATVSKVPKIAAIPKIVTHRTSNDVMLARLVNERFRMEER
jgi:hypothetical protein